LRLDKPALGQKHEVRFEDDLLPASMDSIDEALEPSLTRVGLDAAQVTLDALTDEAADPGEVASPPAKAADVDFRAKYIRRLTSSRVWVPPPARPPMQQTVIIFDWDDTLLCTSWLAAAVCKRGSPLPLQVAAAGKLACKMLARAMSLGRTYIITNAATGWVEHSAQKWAPDMLPWLRKVPVISARDSYEATHPADPERWKVETFLDVQRGLPDAVVTNLIVLGDSEFEMAAARSMRKQFDTAVLKTVKFLPNPSPATLLKQMELVLESFGRIVSRPVDARIDLNRKA